MKRMNVILATVTIGASALLSTVNSYAGDEMSITPITAEKKARVELKSLKSIDVSIFVTNDNGSVLHEETIKSKNSYGRLFDFTHLSDGKYTIISNDDLIKTISEVKVHKSSVEVLSNEVEYKPIFSTKAGSLRVNYLNINGEDIKFTIEGGNSVHYESADGNGLSYQKMLDISKMLPGDYYATVEAGDKTYSYYFYVR